MQKLFFLFIFSLLLALALPSYAVLEIPNTQPKVAAEAWKPVLDKTWEGIKKRNIQPYGTGLIHRPKSETPGDAVSEGVGYGMLLALYSNDQETFNTIWEAGNNNLGKGVIMTGVLVLQALKKGDKEQHPMQKKTLHSL